MEFAAACTALPCCTAKETRSASVGSIPPPTPSSLSGEGGLSSTRSMRFMARATLLLVSDVYRYREGKGKFSREFHFQQDNEGVFGMCKFFTAPLVVLWHYPTISC